MVTLDDLERRRAALAEGDLARLLARLVARCDRLRGRELIVPERKAELSVEGGVCPSCKGALAFDPEEPTNHRCSRCDQVVTGSRHDGHWARAQHLWIAERAAERAVVAVLTDDEARAAESAALLRRYYRLYHELPNRDNVLGPSHLFFSTYLESIWLLNYLWAAYLLRERGWLEDDDVESINAIADEAAGLIGDFNEGLSNRQTWNSAALTAVAVWFGDEELAESAIQGRTGLLGHLTDGFDDDGMWVEGENYHLFALRGLLIGIDWARAAGVDLLTNADLSEQLGRALLAPSLTALPDFTFPARRDSRYGVSLAHPAYLECWERGLALLGEEGPQELVAWLVAVYRQPSTRAQTYDAYLHDAGETARAQTDRDDLSAWMLLTMLPALPGVELEYQPASHLLASQGVAVLRQHDRYLSIECGTFAGGHGHPDRLHLTVVADGIAWLADPGTGSYVARDLFWYRSTLAHNAPRIDGVSQTSHDAYPTAFDEQGDWAWISAEHASIRRTVVHGPRWLLDVVEVDSSDGSRRIELPWHLDGTVAFPTGSSFAPVDFKNEFVSGAERIVLAEGSDPIVTASHGDKIIRLHLVGGEVIRAESPGRPGQPRRPFVVVRGEGQRVRLVAVLDFVGGVSRVEVGDSITVTDAADRFTVKLGIADAVITGPGQRVALGGAVGRSAPKRALLAERPLRARGEAVRLDDRPPCDGTLEGFDLSTPLEMADEAHYYRSEDPYQDDQTFSAIGHLGWDHQALYLAVRVTKPDVVLGAADPKPLGRDNEPDDIHLDGIQVYYRAPGGPPRGYLIRPSGEGDLFARAIPGSPSEPVALDGAATVEDDGYLLTVALPCPELATARVGSRIEFDVVVNEMRPDRISRAGQLAWGGGSGWAYLRGDRRDESLWGEIELIG